MKPEKKSPYHPPQITRVVLRREQAILSQCSEGAPGPDSFFGGLFGCSLPDPDFWIFNGCQKGTGQEAYGLDYGPLNS